MAIKRAASEESRLTDPATGQPSRIDLSEFCDEDSEPTRNLVVFGYVQFDRSPCGLTPIIVPLSRLEMD